MPTPLKSICCKEQYKSKKKKKDWEHRLFDQYCLDRDVLVVEYKKLRVCKPLRTRNIKQISAYFQ